MLDKVENEDTGRRFWVRKIFQERKKYSLYHILTDELRLFDKEYFFRFVRMTPQRFEHLLSLVGPHLQRTFFQILFFKFLIKNVISNKMQLKLILFLLLAGRNFSGNKL